MFWLLYLCCYIWLLYLLACQWVTVLNLLLYICFLIYLLVLARDRFFTVYICLKKSYFPISHENYLINISPYLRELANLGCQLENKLLSEYMTFLSFYYKIMKKPYMRINYQKFQLSYFNFMAKTGLLGGNLFWVGQCDPQLSYWRKN